MTTLVAASPLNKNSYISLSTRRLFQFNIGSTSPSSSSLKFDTNTVYPYFIACSKVVLLSFPTDQLSK